MVSCSENNFRDFFQNNVDFLFILDMKGNIIETNNAVHTILGYSNEDLIGKSALIVYPPVYRKEAEETFKQVLTGEKSNCTFPLLSKNKDYIPVETKVFPCVWNSKQVLIGVCRNLSELEFSEEIKLGIQTHDYLLASATDITALKKAESKVKYLFKQQKLLADVSQLLNTTTNLESVLDDVLMLIGEHTNVSRVYILENVKDENIGRMTHEWCNAGIVPLKNNNQECTYKLIPSWGKLLSNKDCIYSNKIEELPEYLYKIFNYQGVMAVLAYPLYMQDVIYGVIGFHECVSTSIWSTDEIDLMRAISNIISNALERKRVLSKLESSELRLKLAIDSARQVLWDLDVKTGRMDVNDVWYKMMGYDPKVDEANLSNWKSMIHPEDLSTTLDLINKHFNGETELYEATYRIRTKDGQWRWALDNGVVVQRDPDNKSPLRAIGTTIDITKQKETELKLTKSLETQNKLFSIIAHDLRGPISNTLPLIEMLTNEKDLDENSRAIFIEELKKSAKNTYDLLDNLLNWSRSQTNLITLQPQPINLNNIFKNNIDLLLSSASQKRISIKVNTTKDLFAFADINTLSLIVRNLLSNAIKFTHDNGCITISTLEKDSQIQIEIADNGIGMKKEVLDNLFASDLVNSTFGTNNEKGSGLGLALCKDFAERNGGQLRCESTLGKGSTFIITIPKINPYV